MDGDMKNLTLALRKPVLGAALLFGLNATSHAEVYTAPNGSEPPQAKPSPNPVNPVAPLTAPSLKSAEEPGEPPVSWNDTYIGYRYGQDFHYPGVPGKVIQNIGYLTTTGGFKAATRSMWIISFPMRRTRRRAGLPTAARKRSIAWAAWN
jgi:hypothetical protein